MGEAHKRRHWKGTAGQAGRGARHHHRIHLGVVSALFFLGAIARAQPIPPDEAAAFTIDSTATLSLESAINTTDGHSQKLELVYQPEVVFGFSPDVSLTAIGRFRGDGFDELEPGRPSQPEVSDGSRRGLIGDRFEAELREFYLGAQADRARLTLGKQQIVWGRADGLKVLDVVNPQDYREFILDEFEESRIPLWSVNFEAPVDPFVLQLIWVPDLTQHDLPEEGAAYEFTSPLAVPPAPAGVPVDMRSPRRPGRIVSDSDAGVKASTIWGGWELSVNYLYHMDDFPVFERRLIAPGGVPTVQVTPRYRRTHVVGGTFSNAFGDFALRGEFAAFLNRGFSTPDASDADGVIERDDLMWVLGIDYLGIEETLLSAQLFQSWLPGGAAELTRDEVETNITFLARHELLNDRLALELMWLHSIDHGDGLLRPRATYELDDRTTVWVGVDYFYGSGFGLFGQYDRNDRVVIGVQWGF